MKIDIVPIVVNSEQSEKVEIRIVGHSASASQLNIYYQFYSVLELPIDGGEGNLFISNTFIDSTIDAALQAALETEVGAVESWILSFLSLYTNRAQFEYVQGGETLHTRIDFSLDQIVGDEILASIFTDIGIEKAIAAPIQLAMAINADLGLTSTQADAHIAFVQELIDADAYMDMIAVHPLLGDTLAKKYRNILDPDDLDESFRLSVTAGSPTDDPVGLILAHSHADILDTHINMIYLSGEPRIGAGVYLQNEPGSVVYGDTSSFFTQTYRDADGKCYPDIGAVSGGVAIAAGKKGHWDCQRTDIDHVEVWNEGVLQLTDPTHSLGLLEDTVKLAVGFAGINAQLSLFYLHRQFTSAKQVAVDAAVQNFMTALGRNVAP